LTGHFIHDGISGRKKVGPSRHPVFTSSALVERARIPVTVLFLAILVAALPAIAAEKVTIPARTEAGEEMKLPGILHRPSLLSVGERRRER
jgi:hypothetical protein